MDLSVTDTERALEHSAREWLRDYVPYSKLAELDECDSGYDPSLWESMAALGWMEIPFSGSSDSDASSHLAVLIQELGAAAFGSPFYQTVAASGTMLQRLGNTSVSNALMSDIAIGKVRASLVAPVDRTRFASAATTNGSISTITGKLVVEWASIADVLIVPVRLHESGFIIIAVSPSMPGVTVTPVASMDNERIAYVQLTDVAPDHVQTIHDGVIADASLISTLALIDLYRCANVVGGARRVLEFTVDYMRQRHQFGRPLGSFQAVQHSCADMALQADASYLALFEALSRVRQGDSYTQHASMACYFASRAYEMITQRAAQLHGAIGAMREHHLHYYYRRAKAQRLRFGSERHQLSWIASSLADSRWWY